MKKSTFVNLIIGTIGGLLFALGMCMCLLPEWNAFGLACFCFEWQKSHNYTQNQSYCKPPAAYLKKVPDMYQPVCYQIHRPTLFMGFKCRKLHQYRIRFLNISLHLNIDIYRYALSLQYNCVIVKFSFPINHSLSIKYCHIFCFNFTKKKPCSQGSPSAARFIIN